MSKNCRIAIAAFGIFCLFISTATEAASHSDSHIKRVEEGLLPVAAEKIGVPANIADRMRTYGVPGLSIAVIDQARIAWAKGYGVADTTTGRPVATDTLFQAASIGKPISAMGVLLLAQKGLLDLDRGVNEKLQAWTVPENDLTRMSPVTARELLNHTAGVAHLDSNGDVPLPPGDMLPTLLEALKGEPPARSGPVRVLSLPGKSFEYSGAGYEILQQLVSDITGGSFGEYMHTQVLLPFGMASSTFSQPLPNPLLRKAATGHYAGGSTVPGSFRLGPELAVAGLWATPTDIAKYVINVQRSYAGSVAKPLNINMTRQMLKPGMGGRGLGPAISGVGQTARFGHDGFNEGFESSFIGYIHEGRGAVVMANSSFAFMLIKEILDSISRVYEWSEYGPTAQQPPSANIHQQLVTPISTRILAGSPGEYRLHDDVKIKIFSRQSRLFLGWPHEGMAEIFGTPTGRFFCPQLIFSEFGNPWLKFIEAHANTAKILVGEGGGAELRRIN